MGRREDGQREKSERRNSWYERGRRQGEMDGGEDAIEGW